MPSLPTDLKTLVSRIFSGIKDEALHSQAATVLEQAPEQIIAEALRLMPEGYDPVGKPAVDITQIDPAVRTLAQPPEPGYTWHDCIGRRTVKPLLYCTPGSLAELVDLVKQATAAGRRVKSIGSGHSFSDVADAPDYMIDTHALASPLPLDPDTLRNPAQAPQLFRVQGGIVIKDLNDTLDQAGVGMLNLGGYTGQTIVGAISTGTHGSGMQLGPLADFVASLQLITTGGKLYQIEPANGITDPAKFSGTEDGLEIELVQNDDWFYTAIVSMGCFGIIYSLCLQVRPKYWLQETRTLEDWSQIKQEIQDPNLLRTYRHYEVMLNPHTWQGRRNCLVTRRQLVDTPPQEPVPGEKIRSPFVQLLSSIQGNGSALLFFMNKFPQWVPWLLNQCISALQDQNYVAPSYKIFDLGAINDVRAYGIEVGVPFDQAANAAERVFDLAQSGQQAGQYTTAPFALRFVNGTNALLAPMYGRLTCMVEMICMYGAMNSDQTLLRYETGLLEFSGRPHWGLSLGSLQSLAQVRALYPQSLDRWLTVYRQLNSNGTFNNAFTDRIGISINPATQPAS